MDVDVQEQARTKLIRTLMVTLIFSVMSATMFNIVLRQMSIDFDLSISQVSWVMSAYSLIYAIGTVTYGKLADRYQLKSLLTFGLIVFTMGSLIGLFSFTFWMVIVGRCLQAIGAAVVPAVAMLIPVRYFPEERRGYAFGMTAVGLALGNALGPIISALIVSFTHWRWLFCVPIPILCVLPVYRKYLEDEQAKDGKYDWLGCGLLGVAVALFLVGVTNGSWWIMASGVVLIGLFIVRIHYAANPFVQPKIFHNKNYSLGLVIAFFIHGIGFSLPYTVPLLLSGVHNLDPDRIGYAMVPAAVASAILGRRGGKIADAKGNGYLFNVAAGLLLACFIGLSTFTGQSAILIAIFLIFGNVGFSFIMIAITNSISRTMAKEQAGVAMGFLSMLSFIAGSVAVSIYSRVIDVGSSISWNPMHTRQVGFIFSNIYLVLAMVLVCISLLYYYQFGKGKERYHDKNV